MVRDFPKSANQPNEMVLTQYHLKFGFLLLFSIDERLNWQIVQMVRKFPTFRSERKKRTTSGGSPQFSNGLSGKLLFHLTFNRNFRIFWLNGKHPHLYTWVKKRHCGSNNCPRGEQRDPGQCSNPEPLDPESSALTLVTKSSHT